MKTACALMSALLPAMMLAPSPGGQGLPEDPTGPEAHDRWVSNPTREAEETTTLDAALTQVSGGGVVRAGTRARASLRIDDPEAEQITVTPRVADPAGDVGEARVTLAQTLDPFDQVGEAKILDAADDDAAPTSREAAKKAGFDGRDVTVDLPELDPGLYPVAVEVRSDTEVTSQRFLLSVEPDAPGEGSRNAEDAAEHAEAAEDFEAPATADTADPAPSQAAIAAIVPITEEINTVAGETGDGPSDPEVVLEDDSLADSMRPGGRLDQLLAVLEKQGPGAGTCLAIDPQLVDTVDRMSSGYTIAASRVSQVDRQTRLRDSWTASKNPNDAEPGTGKDAAAAWLDRLRGLSQGCTIAMPWGNTDLEAVTRTGDQWLLREAVHRGPATLRRVLDAQPLDDVVFPGARYVTAATAHALETIGRPPEDAAHIEQTWEAGHAAQTTGADSDADGPRGHTGEADAAAATGEVRVIVADNTIWGEGRVGRFANLDHSVHAVTLQGSITAALDLAAQHPITAAYSNPEARFDYRLDSPTARVTTARAGVSHAVTYPTSATAPEEPAAPEASAPAPLLCAFPATVTPEALDAVGDVINHAPQITLADYLSADARTDHELMNAAQPNFGLPFVSDPGAHADSEVQRAMQQAGYIDELTRIMANDDAIAQTRYGFTSPLLRDVLAAMSSTWRRAMGSFNAAVDRTSHRLDGCREVLQSLRSSVELIPPGNVYTRSSESSPLLIVARNGLPLPAHTGIKYATGGRAELNSPDPLLIPARGSITVEMTADVPKSDRQTQLTLWLSTVDGAQISEPVEITVQTRSTLAGAVFTVVALAAAAAAFAAFQGAKKRRSSFR